MVATGIGVSVLFMRLKIFILRFNPTYMSSYRALTKHPETNSYTWAEWRDDYFGPHHYGVRFDGENRWHDPKDKFLKVIDDEHEDWFEDRCPFMAKVETTKESGGHRIDMEFPEFWMKLIAAEFDRSVAGLLDDDDAVNNPAHYNDHPSGIECIEVTRHMSFNLGNAIKYLWRHGKKDPEKTIEDLRKAVFYIEDEIKRIEGGKDA